DVEEAQFVRSRRVIGDGRFHRIAGVAQIDEVDPLDDAAVLHIETGHNSGFEGHRTAAPFLHCAVLAAAPLRASWPSFTSRQGMIRASSVMMMIQNGQLLCGDRSDGRQAQPPRAKAPWRQKELSPASASPEAP